MLLAIIIPYYKIAFFEATLQSLENQTNKRFKVYIGDDASPENPSDILKKYSDSFTFKYKRFAENLGGISLVQQWERCIDLMDDEEWLMILGDDDVLSENIVEEFYNNLVHLESEKINVVRFASLKVNASGDKISKVYLNPRFEKSTDFLFRKTRSSLSEYVFKAEKVRAINFKDFPLGWYSDILAMLEFSEFDTVLSINNAVVSVRISEQSISGSSNNLEFKSQAAFHFHYYLLRKKSHFFSGEQISQLFDRISKSYLNDKKNVKYFFMISSLYIYKFRWRQYIGFLKQIYFKLLKRQ